MACRQSVIGLILLGLYLIPATFSSSTTTQTTTTPAQTTTTPAPTTTQTTTTTTPAPTTTPTPTIPETTMDTTRTGSITAQSTTTSQTNTLSKATSAKESTTTTTGGPSPDSTTTTTTTPVPSGEKGSSSPTTTSNTRTQGETVSTTPGSSQSAPTTTEHSDKSTGAPSTTTTTASATTMEVTGTTSATAASPGVSATTKAATTISSTTTEAPTMPKILINEFTHTGLFSSGNKIFVELKKQGNVSDTFPENLTLVVMDGKTDLKCQGIQVVHSNWTSSLTVVKVDLEKKDDRKSIVVALYATDTWGNCPDYEHNTTADVMDVMVLGKSSKAVNISDVTERFQLSGTFNVLVVDESKLKGKGKYSVSRCNQTAMNVGSFVVAMETLERENNCSMPENLNRTLYFNASTGVKCHSFTNQTFKDLLKNYIAKNVGDKCACGLSPQLISLTTHACKWMKQSFSISAITVDQLQLINKYFNSTLKVNTCLKNDTTCLTSPCQNCGHLPQPSKEKGKINVTVAVVITCIVVFLVIVFVVIIYIRRKRRGILQFRMTRLNEDDDDLIGQDTDDFVGSQDASFSNSSYSRFQ